MLRVVPITLREANAYVSAWHRHRTRARGCVFCVAVAAAHGICGVAIVGRPNARMLQNGLTLEVTRCATDGTRNACSALYGTARRVALILGYERVSTYNRVDESGASLRGAGFVPVAAVRADTGERPTRQRAAKELIAKVRWENARAATT